GSGRHSNPRGGVPSRSGSRPAPPSRNTTRSGTGARRPGPRTTGTGLRPANPRLLRQRLFVFVVVTLVVALGIALVQGCQGPG
ncbi:serine/threonine protein kinase, partial [Streptomyces pilosus]